MQLMAKAYICLRTLLFIIKKTSNNNNNNNNNNNKLYSVKNITCDLHRFYLQEKC